MTTSNWVIAIEGFETVQVDETNEGWGITICPIGGTASCPVCGQTSQTLHSKYVRGVRDLPVGDRPVKLTIEARKFKCGNAGCERKIFCERLTNFVVVRGQRSKRLTVMYRAIAFAVSAESGKRLTKDLKVVISADTLIRIVRATELTTVKDLSVIGVDDWALKKGQRYGTVIVDHETGHPVDLFEGRTSEALTAWLKPHAEAGIRVVTRDRSTEYVRAIHTIRHGSTTLKGVSTHG
jgi:transposase